MPRSSSTFGKGENNKRGRGKRPLYLEALQEEIGLMTKNPELDPEGAEKEFYRFNIRVGMGLHQYFEENQEGGLEVKFGKPDAQMLKDGMARLFPVNKATFEKCNIDIPKDATRSQKLDAIVDAAITGKIAPDIATTLISGLVSGAKVEEVDSLLERVAKLEEMLKSSDG